MMSVGAHTECTFCNFLPPNFLLSCTQDHPWVAPQVTLWQWLPLLVAHVIATCLACKSLVVIPLSVLDWVEGNGYQRARMKNHSKLKAHHQSYCY